MKKLLRLKCWLTRHHWLLQGSYPVSRYVKNDKVAEYTNLYCCQVCGKLNLTDVINLDNLPNNKENTNADQ